MIFHLPYRPNPEVPSGGQLRPLKMLRAFETLGGLQGTVIGDGAERSRQIQALKKKIGSGMKCDFLYSESSSMPTLLTERHHFPVFPFLDFSFFRFCKEAGMKIGLFYRDIHWNYDQYRSKTSGLKQAAAALFYRYDFWQYTRWVDVLYLPSLEMRVHLPFKAPFRVEALPSGCDALPERSLNRAGKTLKILYVGGLDPIHEGHLLFQAVAKRDYLSLVVSCRNDLWQKSLEAYRPLLNDRISVIFKKGEELSSLYEEADLLALFLKPTPYWDFAMPYKLFEYLGYEKPILAVKGTAVGNFVESNDIGWSIEYDDERFVTLTDWIKQHPEAMLEKKKNILRIKPLHTWEARARKVSSDLTG